MATFPLFSSTIVVMMAATYFSTHTHAQHSSDKPIERSIERLDPAINELLALDAKIEEVSHGHQFTEGPVWDRKNKVWLFSDIPSNEINRWDPATGKTTVFLSPAGYDGPPIDGNVQGTNGLAFDQNGHLIGCDHGNRRIYRLEADGTKTTLAERFMGRRFNSPNDLVLDSSGAMYFTDPPYGMVTDDTRELDYYGVFRMTVGGKITLLTKQFSRPNGIGLSPDGNTLYVAQSDRKQATLMSFPVKTDGSLGEGEIFFDATSMIADPGLPDGLAVDSEGNVWGTGPGGVLILSPEGKLLGRILMGQGTANCAFGGGDGSTLLMTSANVVCRIKTKVKGIGW